MANILVVDDQAGMRRSLGLLLRNAGFTAWEAANGEQALQQLESSPPDLVITDLRMDGMSGMDLLKELRRRQVDVPVIVITAYGSIESAVEAMRLGAFDYITKPFDEAEILEKIRASQAGGRAHFPAEVRPAAGGGDDELVASSPIMQAVLIRIGRLAQADINVLITGETGTGKSRAARMIHQQSRRAAYPFVGINCASVPESLLESELFGHVRGSFTGANASRHGLFEEADNGTILLDEIDTLPLSTQAKLLHVIQDKVVRPIGANKIRAIDVRIICAANQELTGLMRDGLFRADLYFRINGARLHLPPLRERRQDIAPLVNVFLNRFSRKYNRRELRLTSEAMQYLEAYPYPGNIRQLEAIIEQVVVFAADGTSIGIDVLPEEIISPSAFDTSPEDARIARSVPDGTDERQLIEAVLNRHNRLADAARELRMGRTTLWRKMRQYKIEKC